jgi:hypothetical protein
MGKVVHIRYGKNYIAWNYLAEMVASLASGSGYALASPELGRLDIGFQFKTGVRQIDMIKWVQDCIARGKKASLTECLANTSYCLAKDPLDRIFAFVGLISRPPVDNDSSYDEVVKVDYSLPPEELLQRVASYILQREPAFLLERSGVGFQRGNFDIPSWVPDWGTAERTFEVDIPASSRYSAGGNAPISFDCLSSSKICLVAAPLSRVKEISHSTINFQEPFRGTRELIKLSELIKSALELAMNIPDVYKSTGQSRSEASWRTLVGDRVRVGLDRVAGYIFPAPPEYGVYFHNVTQKIFPTCLSLLGPSGEIDDTLTVENLIEILRSLERVRKQTEGDKGGDLSAGTALQINMLSQAIVGACKERRFASTEDGLLCLVPLGAEIGDEVCVVPGLSKPLLFRSSRVVQNDTGQLKTWKFVGDCYVHGFMRGEAWENAAGLEKYVVE